MSRARASTALTHWFTWRHVRCKVIETPDYFAGQTHLELHAIAARDVPLPITQTGYRSHFIAAQALVAAGGAVAFFTAWMDAEAQSRSYRNAEFRWRQGELFPELEGGPRSSAR